MSKHTPGPWALRMFDTPGSPNRGFEINAEGTQNVVWKLPHWRPNAQNEANGMLIAASPELLDALKRIQALDNESELYGATLKELVDLAISKAEGKNP